MIARSAVARWALAVLSFVATPGFLSAVLLLGGAACAIFGVYVLAGMGWSLIAAAIHLLALGAVLLRGVLNGA